MKLSLILIISIAIIFLFLIIISSISTKKQEKEYVFNEYYGTAREEIIKEVSLTFNLELNSILQSLNHNISLIFKNVSLLDQIEGSFNKEKFIFKGSEGIVICYVNLEFLGEDPILEKDVVLYCCSESKCYRDARERNGKQFSFYVPFPANESLKYVYIVSYSYLTSFLGSITYENKIGLYRVSSE